MLHLTRCPTRFFDGLSFDSSTGRQAQSQIYNGKHLLNALITTTLAYLKHTADENHSQGVKKTVISSKAVTTDGKLKSLDPMRSVKHL